MIYYAEGPKWWHVILALGIICVSLGSVGYTIYDVVLKTEEPPKEVRDSSKPILSIESDKKVSRSCVQSKSGKRCVVINRFSCPKGWGPPRGDEDCEERLIACSDALSGIKKWCDPTCHDMLEECLAEIKKVRDGCYPLTTMDFYF